MTTNRSSDLLLTSAAPAIWGSTYVVTTLMLPPGIPLTVAMLRALPAGLLLFVRQLPQGVWWPRVFLLGALNFSVFWAMLFVATACPAAWRRRWRDPAAAGDRVGAAAAGRAGAGLAVLAAAAGLGGVALLVLTPKAALDPVGVAAGWPARPRWRWARCSVAAGNRPCRR